MTSFHSTVSHTEHPHSNSYICTREFRSLLGILSPMVHSTRRFFLCFAYLPSSNTSHTLRTATTQSTIPLPMVTGNTLNKPKPNCTIKSLSPLFAPHTDKAMALPTFNWLGLSIQFDSPQTRAKTNPWVHQHLRAHRKNSHKREESEMSEELRNLSSPSTTRASSAPTCEE